MTWRACSCSAVERRAPQLDHVATSDPGLHVGRGTRRRMQGRCRRHMNKYKKGEGFFLRRMGQPTRTECNDPHTHTQHLTAKQFLRERELL